MPPSPPSPAAEAPDAGARQDLLHLLRLARTRGVGPRTARLLVERAGSVARLFALGLDELVALGVPRRLARSLADAGPEAAAREELALIEREGWRLLGLGLPGYPAALAEIHDPPLTLAVEGALLEEDARAVAVVGARRATPAGLEVTRRLAGDLARAGVTVVSGLARGVDRAAHEGALAAGGRTVAVLGSGLHRVYPEAHRELALRIARAGAVVSEHHPEQEPSRHTFPRRNRIVAGLSLGVVVVQAGPRSGALITAELALAEGRELLAVPGCVLEPLARGPNGLIKDGARLVETADDVLDAVLGVAERAAASEPAEADGAADPGTARPTDDEPTRALLATLHRTRPRRLEELAAAAGLSALEAMTCLGRLELEARVAAGPAGYVLVS